MVTSKLFDGHDIEQNALQQCQANLGIVGAVASSPVLEASESEPKMQVGRFGWKSQHSSLLSSCADSLRNELGVRNRLYPDANRLYKVAQGSTNTAIGYDNANRRNSLTLPNGIVLTYGFDNDSRINSMSYQVGTTSVGSLTYQYDAAGRRIQVGGSLAATGFPQAMSSAAYDVANELTNWNGTTITPDANGNILNDGVASYTWNARNQLISRGSTSFQYDSYGRRTLNAAGNSLLYEGLNAGQELSGTTPVANRILGGIDEFFNRTDSTGAYSPITDALGTVLALTNSSGNTVTQYIYEPYGNTTSYGGTSTNVSQYTGRENDGNGLYFYRARYYSPQFGRFVSEDPLGFRGGVNLYGYAGGSPGNLSDPLGLSPAGRNCCIAAANRRFINGVQGPGAANSFATSQPDGGSWYEIAIGLYLSGGDWEGAGLGYVAGLLRKGGSQAIDYWKNWADKNDAYEKDIAACESQ
jgi:RHS repeat-associated protein